MKFIYAITLNTSPWRLEYMFSKFRCLDFNIYVNIKIIIFFFFTINPKYLNS